MENARFQPESFYPQAIHKNAHGVRNLGTGIVEKRVYNYLL